QIINKSFLKEDEKVLKSIHHENDEEFDNEVIETFNEKENFKLAQTLKKVLQLPTLSSFDIKFVFYLQLPVKLNIQAFKGDFKESMSALLHVDVCLQNK